MIILLAIIDFMDRQIVASLLPYIKEEYGATDSQLGLMISIVNYSMVIFVIPSGYLIDRWSRKKMLSLMAIIWSLATAACGLAGTFSHLVAARFFIGTGEAGYNPAGQTLLSASFPRRLRASVCSAIPGSMWLGAPLGLMIGAFIAEHWGWRHAFGVVAVPGIALGIVALFCRDFRTVRQDIPGECGGGEEPAGPVYLRGGHAARLPGARVLRCLPESRVRGRPEPGTGGLFSAPGLPGLDGLLYPVRLPAFLRFPGEAEASL